MYSYFDTMKISVIGTGYVGLVSGVCFAKQGHNVICVDVDKDKIEKINNGISPIYEKGLEELLNEFKDNISATNSYGYAIKNSDVTFICVGTPSTVDGIDLTHVEQATIEIGRTLKNKDSWHLVVVKSTVLPKTSEDFVLPLLEKYSGKKAGDGFGLCMNPEFLREGVAVNDFLMPDRIIIGSFDSKSRELLYTLYDSFSSPIVHTSLTAAEMIKYASNCFLATKISFINEIGNFCKNLGINSYEVADGIGLDSRIGRSFLDSGIGWGGSCFPKDLHALIAWADDNAQDSLILKNVVEVNDRQPLKLFDILKRNIALLDGKTIGVLGLSFKPKTDDIRNSRSIPIVEKLLDEGAIVKAYDPKGTDNFKKIFPNLIYCDKAEQVLNSDAVLILTKWEEFIKLDFSGKIVIDGRNLAEARNAKIYEGVCW